MTTREPLDFVLYQQLKREAEAQRFLAALEVEQNLQEFEEAHKIIQFPVERVRK